MDRLKTYIDHHREAFDDEMPRAGHVERFEKKLERSTPHRVAFRLVWAAAAAIVIFLSAGLWLWQPFGSSSGPVTVICENTDDMKSCYLSQMYETAEVIDRLSAQLDTFTRGDMQMEVADIIQTSRRFDRELPESLPEQETKEILSDYYKHNLAALQQIAQALTIK